jgi:hypothetical protein
MAADCIQRGKLAYKNGKYEDAAKLFGAARTSATRPQDVLSSCDLQIGALVKIKSIEPALTIAKDMIRVNRKDARGYIRAAQVERLAERPAAAARWYQHGLKHISPSDPLYVSLQSGIKKCENQITQAAVRAKPCDPFMTLPVEVARIVLSHLDYRQTTAILRVSKAWRSFLTKEEPLLTTVDFSQARKDVNISALGACLRRLKQYPKEATLTNLTDNAAKDMSGRMPRWLDENTLQKLVLADKVAFSVYRIPKEAKLVYLEARVSDSEHIEILSRSPSLKRMNLSIVTVQPFLAPVAHNTLEHLRLSSAHRITALRSELNLPMLRSLRLDRIDVTMLHFDWSALRVLHLTRCRVSRGLRLTNTLTDLILDDNMWSGISHYHPQNQLVLPDLASLRAPLDAWELDLHDVVLEPSKIQTIDIVDCRIADSDASKFLSKSALRRLTIRNGIRLTGVFVKDLICDGSGELEHIELIDCENVSPSTSAWAKSEHGIRVDIKNTTDQANARSGRRVFG